MSTPTASRASQIGTTPGSGGRPGPTGTDAEPWWRSAVVYQIYPRSFFDADGDGTGDLRGITSHLDHVVSLGADAIWISPWYPSPMVDGGYDVADYCDIHPDFGTLDDADTLISTAHAKGLRVLIDLVPNHCSSQHPWFREAVSGGPGHPMRDRFVFRDGTGAHGELPPNNWPSVFGGAAWQRVVEPDGRPGQWYLHFFDPGQPDWNWDNEEVRAEFDRILRFWFDRGVDGFRVDVADALVKDMSLPDVPIDPRTGRGTLDKSIDNPMWDQPGLAEVQRRWRAIAREYADTPGGERVFVAEAYLPHDRLVQFLTPDRFQQRRAGCRARQPGRRGPASWGRSRRCEHGHLGHRQPRRHSPCHQIWQTSHRNRLPTSGGFRRHRHQGDALRRRSGTASSPGSPAAGDGPARRRLRVPGRGTWP